MPESPAIPPEVRDVLTASWAALPPDLRRTFESSLNTLARILADNPAAVTDLMAAVQSLVAPALAPVTRVAILGPVNVGKSTLYNVLVPDATHHARTGPVPGTTHQVQAAQVGLFQVADTPGADNAVDASGAERAQAFAAARAADFLVIVLDATRGVTTSDRDLFADLRALKKKQVVALNKIDRVERRQRRAVVEAAARALGLSPFEVVPVSATLRTGTDRLVLEMAAAEPRLLGELGRILAPLRRKLAGQAVRRAAITAVLVALTPIPILDLIPLTALQIGMILTIARIYDRPMTAARAGEVIGTMGTGLLARTLFGELSKLGGLPGWMLSCGIAGSVTTGLGAAAIHWFETGQRPTRAEVEGMARRTQRLLMDRLRRLGRLRPRRRTATAVLERQVPDLVSALFEPPATTVPAEPDSTPPGSTPSAP